MLDDIRALKELLDIGAITQEEFDEKKADLLSRALVEHEASRSANEPIRQKSKVVAGLLALFLGGLGVHKFYLGYTSEGIALLLLTLLGSLLLGIGAVASGIISLVEAIIYLTKTDEEFDETYVKGHKGWF